MARGRRPLPTAVKELRGNPGKRKLNEAEPVPAAGEPEMPKGLSEGAAAEWNRILPGLMAMRIITPVDRATLAAYCYAYDIWMQANDEIREFGVMIKFPIMGRKGTPEENEVISYLPKKNPALAIASDALKTMNSYGSLLGVNPVSRANLHVEKPKEEDPFDAWAKQKAERNAAQATPSEKPN